MSLANSIHTARWIAQLDGQGWDLSLFDFTGRWLHAEMPAVNYLTPPLGSEPKTLRNLGPKIARRIRQSPIGRILPAYSPSDAPRPGQFARQMQRLRPDIIHVMGLQLQGYPFFEEWKKLKHLVDCQWIYSCWGNDLFWFERLPEHESKIREFLAECPNLYVDAHRDIEIARRLGFKGRDLGVLPVGGGFDLDQMATLRSPLPPSQRRTIACKGYEHWAGRFSAVLKAFELCLADLRDFRIAVYSPTPAARELIAAASPELQSKLDVLPSSQPPIDIYRLFGESRVSIAASISDGLPNSMQESMIMGAFPIQTNPGGATAEWVDDGQNGFLIDYDNIPGIADRLRSALGDDDLVDRAAERNTERVQILARAPIRQQVIAMYEQMLQSKPA